MKTRHEVTAEQQAYLALVRKRIRETRKQTRLTQEEVADKMDISVRMYQRFEAENPREGFNPTLLNLLAYCEAVGIEITWLLRKPETPDPDTSVKTGGKRS
ncbi:helix-turn-helix domain-containing protein [Deinococcus roseus]|uniref:helix-turn-helix domain-containing protein n=1 Tax=Deinococcus roseus TaxID=392414 RepID=UPI00166ABA77|nr:helix-turn-helix transcriptional regulator [Deinococcus roseus]